METEDMKNMKLLLAACIIAMVAWGCSKRTTPEKSNSTATVAVKKPAVPKIKTPTPKVIVVSDSIARKTFDGRYYYDLGGKRYWRNNKDGKYYLYNKGMLTNEAFKSPAGN
jgi:hypothetical protein